MRITITVPGRFHAFETAAELHKRGHLQKVITPLPFVRIRRHSALERSMFSTTWQHTAYRVASSKLPVSLPEVVDCSLFDWSARLVLPRSMDICIGYAGASLHTLRRARLLGAKTVVERHSAHREEQMALLHDEHEQLGLPFRTDPAMMRRELLEYAEADAICVPSRFVERTFTERGFSKDKLLRVPLGVNLERFRPVRREDARFKVVFAGAFSVQKGIKYLLEAWRKVALPDAELWFLGSADPVLRRMLRPDELPGVRMLGHVDERELGAHLSQCDVLCLPSIQDGFGAVMAQAMACGLVVIHSTNTGGADLVRPGIDGHEFPIRDSDTIATLIEDLYRRRKACREMGQQAIRRVASLGGWTTYGDETTSAYSRLIGLTPSASNTP